MEKQEQSGQFKHLNICTKDLEISVKIVENQKLKAIVTIDFKDLVIKGFRVFDSEHENDHGYNLWVTPPSYQSGGGKYHPIFFMEDKELWKQVEKKICQEYEKASDEHFQKRMGIGEEVDIEDIKLK